MMPLLGCLFVGNRRRRFGHTGNHCSHGSGWFAGIVELGGVQASPVLDGNRVLLLLVLVLIHYVVLGGSNNLAGLRRDVLFSRGESVLLFAQKDRVPVGSEHDISKNIVQIQGGGRPAVGDGGLGSRRQICREHWGRGWLSLVLVLIVHLV